MCFFRLNKLIFSLFRPFFSPHSTEFDRFGLRSMGSSRAGPCLTFFFFKFHAVVHDYIGFITLYLVFMDSSYFSIALDYVLWAGLGVDRVLLFFSSNFTRAYTTTLDLLRYT